MATKRIKIASKLTDQFVIETQVRGHKVVIDQPANAGGTDSGVTPLELILISLSGCIGTLGRIVAMQQRIELRGMDIQVEAEVDVDGLLGKPIDGRIGYQAIHVKVEVDADMTDAEKETFLHEVDRRCPISENLLNATPIHVTLT